MNDEDVRAEARQAGIAVNWTDVRGQNREIAPDVLARVLAALGRPGSASQPLVTGDRDRPIAVPGRPGRYRVLQEDGAVQEGVATALPDGRVEIGQIALAGYHRLQLDDAEMALAIAPPRCWTVDDATAGRRAWGLTAQLYSLRRAGDGGVGDFSALSQLARQAGTAGCAAIAISPVHAQFSADAGNFSPYTPSSRAMLNVLHADPGPDHGLVAPVGDDLLDWRTAAPARLAACRVAFERQDFAAEFRAFRLDRGEALERHARFEALHADRLAARQWDWHGWPEQLRAPGSQAVARFAAGADRDVSFHAFLQFLADRGLAQAQESAVAAGMKIGLIADIAIGVSPGGSDAWSRREEMLDGLTIGAPPDMYNPAGQDWGVTTFSPHGLVGHGYQTFLEMLRTAMRHAGGLRLDHVMGLARLWVVPAGCGPGDGAFLRYPLDDLLRLVKLESVRNRAIVLGEDLGTLPDGFQDRLARDGIAGMRVMWFERDGDRFRPPAHWTPQAVAMTSTHDLPTVAGWWSGRDLDWRGRLGQQLNDAQHEERSRDRSALWQAFTDTGSASGDAPAPDQGAVAADIASAHLGTAACGLALLPLEDALALPEQPNFPGTIDEHPNWRRRFAAPADTMLTAPDVAARLRALARTRP